MSIESWLLLRDQLDSEQIQLWTTITVCPRPPVLELMNSQSKLWKEIKYKIDKTPLRLWVAVITLKRNQERVWKERSALNKIIQLMVCSLKVEMVKIFNPLSKGSCRVPWLSTNSPMLRTFPSSNKLVVAWISYLHIKIPNKFMDSNNKKLEENVISPRLLILPLIRTF
jgi:hypothetical protein